MKFTAALAGSFCGFALACAYPAAQQAVRPAADSAGGTDEIVVPGHPTTSVELMSSPQGAPSGALTNGDADAAKAPTPGMAGYIEGGVGTNGLRTMGGGLHLPLAGGKLQISIEGYSARTDGR